jgi:hypothetical protein
VIEDFPTSDQPPWRMVAQESLALAATGLLFPFGLRTPECRTPRQAVQRTVVLVHGYLANRSALLPLATYLRWRGVSQVLGFNYPSSGVRSACETPCDDGCAGVASTWSATVSAAWWRASMFSNSEAPGA